MVQLSGYVVIFDINSYTSDPLLKCLKYSTSAIISRLDFIRKADKILIALDKIRNAHEVILIALT